MSSNDDRLDSAYSRVSGEDGLSGLMVALFGGTLMTVGFQFWDLISGLGGTIMAPFQAFGEALGTLVSGSIGGPVELLEAAVDAGMVSLTDGLFAQLGIFAYPVTMLSVMLGIYIFAEAWTRIDLSPWNFLRNIR